MISVFHAGILDSDSAHGSVKPGSVEVGMVEMGAHGSVKPGSVEVGMVEMEGSS